MVEVRIGGKGFLNIKMEFFKNIKVMLKIMDLEESVVKLEWGFIFVEEIIL